jgi:lambda family phage portal protein
MIKLSDYLEIPTMAAARAERREAEEKRRLRQIKRQYQGARVSRLDKNWTVTPSSANWELYQSLRILRARAREAARNNSHFKKFLSMARKNIVGPAGIQLQSRAKKKDGTLDRSLNKFIEEIFWDWGHKETCTASGKLSWLDCQNLFVTQLARDGEVLVQKVKARNKFGFSLKFVDISYLDESYNEILPNGNRVIMSVEVDKDERPVAYYLTTPAMEVFARRDRQKVRVRVEAKDFIHAFLTHDDESQTRGLTWFHTALIDAKHLQGYKEGVITSAEAAAYTFGILTKKPDENEQFDEDEDEVINQPEINVAPLSMNVLDDDYDFKQFDPKQPTQNHSQFYKSILMDLAIGLDVNYFSLAGDMESVNYSSARVGLGEERDIWQSLQTFVVEHFCREVFNSWLDSAYLSGILPLRPEELFALRNPMWRPRGWKYIDPTKEVAANTEAMATYQKTLTDVLSEQGIDLLEHFETIKNERELAAEYGIELGYGEVKAENKNDAGENGETPANDPERGYVNGLYTEDAPPN